MNTTYPPAIFASGRNYADHAAEMYGELPQRPIIFMKNPASIIGNDDPIILPAICDENGPQVDYEGELAVVLDRDVKDISRDSASDCIRGYAIANDVSARWWQRYGSGGQYIRGKSFDTFCPISDIVPADEIDDPQALELTTKLNGEIVQQASTADMIFPVRTLIAELSRGTTLVAGTVILTGTPAGVGAARTPPRFLQPGDVVEVTIDRLGTLRNRVKKEG